MAPDARVSSTACSGWRALSLGAHARSHCANALPAASAAASAQRALLMGAGGPGGGGRDARAREARVRGAARAGQVAHAAGEGLVAAMRHVPAAFFTEGFSLARCGRAWVARAGPRAIPRARLLCAGVW